MPFVIESDHRPLSYLKTHKNPERFSRILDTILHYPNLHILYLRGRDNVMADFLSRVPMHEDGCRQQIQKEKDLSKTTLNKCIHMPFNKCIYAERMNDTEQKQVATNKKIKQGMNRTWRPKQQAAPAAQEDKVHKERKQDNKEEKEMSESMINAIPSNAICQFTSNNEFKCLTATNNAFYEVNIPIVIDKHITIQKNENWITMDQLPELTDDEWLEQDKKARKPVHAVTRSMAAAPQDSGSDPRVKPVAESIKAPPQDSGSAPVVKSIKAPFTPISEGRLRDDLAIIHEQNRQQSNPFILSQCSPKQWKIEQKKDEQIKLYRKAMKGQCSKEKLANMHGILPYLEEVDGLLYYRLPVHSKVQEQPLRLLVVPRALQGVVWRVSHEHYLFAGHVGREKTTQRILRAFWFPHLHKEVGRRLHSCQVCYQKQRSGKVTIHSPTHIFHQPFDRIAIDIVGPFEESIHGNRYILTVIDMTTRFADAYALPNQSANLCIQTLVNRFFCRYGVPMEILSDNGSQFKQKDMEELLKRLHIKHIYTSTYHPATNGTCERFNGTLGQLIRSQLLDKTNGNKSNDQWDDMLPNCIYIYNTSIHSKLKASPYSLLFGIDPHYESNNDRNDQLQWVAVQREYATKHSVQVQFQSAMDINTRNKLKKPRMYMVGERVYVQVLSNAGTGGKKLHQRWVGPYEVVHRISSHAYRVKQVNVKKGGTARIETLNVTRLRPAPTPYKEQEIKQSESQEEEMKQCESKEKEMKQQEKSRANDSPQTELKYEEEPIHSTSPSSVMSPTMESKTSINTQPTASNERSEQSIQHLHTDTFMDQNENENYLFPVSSWFEENDADRARKLRREQKQIEKERNMDGKDGNWVVRKIIHERRDKHSGKMMYQVMWNDGFGWVSEEQMRAPELLEEWKQLRRKRKHIAQLRRKRVTEQFEYSVYPHAIFSIE